jgi:uncharacterized membrane protein
MNGCRKAGVWIFGLASAAAGVLDVIWGELEPAHQPIQAFGDHIPGQHILAYVAAAWLVAAGSAILWRRTAAAGAVALAAIYFIFAIFWVPRFFTAPRVLGYRPSIFISVMGGMATQLIVAAAAALVYATASMSPLSRQRAVAVARWVIGLSSINFGLTHLTRTQAVATMVPEWMPLGGRFWTVLTGIAFVLAGLVVLSRIMDLLAARLLALMLLVFSAVLLTPGIFFSPHDHVAWGANAYNLAAVGAILIFAESLASPRESTTGEYSP